MSKSIAEILQEMHKPSAGTPTSSHHSAGKDEPSKGDKLEKSKYDNLGNKGTEQGKDEPEGSTHKDLGKANYGKDGNGKKEKSVFEGTRVRHDSWGEGIVLQVNEDKSFDALFEHGVEMNLTARKSLEEQSVEEKDPNRDEQEKLEPKAEGEKAFMDAHKDNMDKEDNPEQGKPVVATKQAPTNKPGM